MHGKIVKLYSELSRSAVPRTVLWEEISRRTGYTREGIQRVLRSNGIDYTKKKDKDEHGV